MNPGPNRSFEVVSMGSSEAKALVDELLMPAANHFTQELDFALSDIEHIDVEKTFTYEDQRRTYFSFDACLANKRYMSEGRFAFFVVTLVQTQPWVEGMYWPRDQELEHIERLKQLSDLSVADLDDVVARELQEHTEFWIDEEHLVLYKDVSCEFHNHASDFEFDPESEPSETSASGDGNDLSVEDDAETYFSEQDVREIKQVLSALGFHALKV